MSEKEIHSECSSQTEKNKMRSQLQDDIEMYLRNGGKVKCIDPNVRADPPRKPNSQYGNNPI